MRILRIQRHFWPDVGVPASMGRAISERLTRSGHRVTNLSAMPSYHDAYAGVPPPRREDLDGYQVIRLRLPREAPGSLGGRARDAFVFTFLVTAHILRYGRRYDVITTSTAPPVLLAAAVRVSARMVRRPYVYHCQDLNPEAALLAGILREGWQTRWLARLDRNNVRRARTVVVLSRDMLTTLRERGLDCRNVVIIKDFLADYDEPPPHTVPPDLRKPPGVFRVLFAGNLGLVQGLETVTEAARLLVHYPDIEFAFVGTGSGEPALRRQAGAMLGKSVVIFPHQPQSVALQMMSEADLGLVSLGPGVIRVAYPSKTFSYLAAGCPVLAVVEPESEMAGIIDRTKVGVTCRPDDPGALAEAVLLLRERQRAGLVQRPLIQEIYERQFGAGLALERWSAVFGDLNGGPVPGRGSSYDCS